TRDPERAELALALATLAIGVLPRLDDGLLGRAIILAASAVVSLCLGQDFALPRARGDASIHSCHVRISLGVRQKLAHGVDVARIDLQRGAELTLTLRFLFRQDVTHVRMAGLVDAIALRAETLCSAAIRLQLRHCFSPRLARSSACHGLGGRPIYRRGGCRGRTGTCQHDRSANVSSERSP